MRSVYFSHLVNGPFGDPALYVRIAHRGQALLFDCGDLGALTTRELLKVRALFVSHAHIDHLFGFDTLLRTFLYQDLHLEIFGPPGIAARIAGRLYGYTWNLVEGFPFVLTVREWGDGAGKVVRFRAANAFRPEPQGDRVCHGGLLLERDDLQVRGVPLEHGNITSMAYALEETLHVAIHKDALERCRYQPGPWLARFKDHLRRGAAEDLVICVPRQDAPDLTLSLGELRRQIAHTERGMKICYVTDAAPGKENCERIVALAADSHLLVIEAPFAHAELCRAQQRNHLTARLAGELARRAGAARLLVFHHSPRYQDRPDLLRLEAEAAFSGQEALASL